MKGSLVITADGDIPLLRLVRNCRFVSHQQLFELLCHDAVLSSRSTFNWRIQRLLKSGGIERQNNLEGVPVYSITRRGLLELERQGEFLIALNSSTRQMPNPVQVFHALELNSLRLALARNALLVSWQSEVEISTLNMVSESFQKDYDAILKIWLGNEIREFALEYERSLKNTKQYENVRAALEAERMIGCVLYVTVDSNLLLAVLPHLTPMARRLGFPHRTFLQGTAPGCACHYRSNSGHGAAGRISPVFASSIYRIGGEYCFLNIFAWPMIRLLPEL
jgi:hypothetical protein